MVSTKGSDLLRQIAVLLVTIATIAINTLAVTLPLNGKSTGEISDGFPVLFTPAGYVFSIWSLIYVGLIAYSIYQLLPAQRANPAAYADAMAGVDENGQVRAFAQHRHG